MEWNDAQPIYRQLRDLVMQRVLDGSFPEGESIPSVRQVAAEYRINHITVSKAYQELVDMGLLEKRRGLGMFVRSGAQAALSSEEKRRFLDEEVPALAARARTLGVAINTIVERLQDAGAGIRDHEGVGGDAGRRGLEGPAVGRRPPAVRGDAVGWRPRDRDHV